MSLKSPLKSCNLLWSRVNNPKFWFLSSASEKKLKIWTLTPIIEFLENHHFTSRKLIHSIHLFFNHETPFKMTIQFFIQLNEWLLKNQFKATLEFSNIRQQILFLKYRKIPYLISGTALDFQIFFKVFKNLWGLKNVFLKIFFWGFVPVQILYFGT